VIVEGEGSWVEHTAVSHGSYASETTHSDIDSTDPDAAGRSVVRSDVWDTREEEDVLMKKILKVSGMMCQHCQMRVEKALGAVDGVGKVEVSLENQTAEVSLEHNVSDEVLKQAVEEAGYTVIEVS
jgi:copper ion binding protein